MTKIRILSEELTPNSWVEVGSRIVYDSKTCVVKNIVSNGGDKFTIYAIDDSSVTYDSQGLIRPIFKANSIPPVDPNVYVIEVSEVLDVKEDPEKVKSATPANLAEVIKAAPAGSTVALAAGNYDLVTLSGTDAFAENITILGGEEVFVDGMSITSGVDHSKTAADSVMAGGLTIKNVNFTKNLSLRNCSMDGLNILNCKFTNGAIAHIMGNAYKDVYGDDTNGNYGAGHREADQSNTVSNVVVSKCSFSGKNDNGVKDETSIIAYDVNNITIKNNVVDGSEFNGIQVGITNADTKLYPTAVSGVTTGEIVIKDNVVSNTGSRSIRLNGFTDATVTVTNNNLSNASLTDPNAEYVKASSMTNTTFTWENNTYNGTAIAVGNGILA